MVLAFQVARRGEAQCRRDARAAVAGAERVVRALAAARVARDAAQLAQRMELVIAAREQLVRIALVADVPDDLVGRRVEHAVQRQREFDHSEIGGQVPGIARDRLDDDVAHLGRELQHISAVEALDVRGGMDLLEHAHG